MRYGIIGGLVAAFAILASAGFWAYRQAWRPNFQPEKTMYVYVDRQKDFEQLCNQLQNAGCRDLASFRRVAAFLDYPNQLKTGRYAVKPGMSNWELVNHLRRGNQVATRVVFNNIRLKEELAERLDDQLMLRADELLQLWNDSLYCDSLGFTPVTLPTLFIPDTYELYWNISSAKLMQRMLREYKAFWNEERLAKAEKIGLKPVEVAILASIVEEETAAVDEYPIVAGLYLNRLKAGIPLQADPTVKFAVGDFTLRRILTAHLEIESPYNTYKHVGLPPGPLRIPSRKGLEAVLNPMSHTYIYMCAKEDFSGRHNFARTLAEHNRNAERYRAELNRRKIR
ncbi:MAG: endolytic transglycosylase MltG [Parabacteroides sp.]